MTVNAMERLANQLRDAGNVDESIVLLRDVVQRRTEALGQDHLHTADAEANLAFSLSAVNRHDEAVPLFEHSIEVASRSRGNDDASVLRMVASLGFSFGWLRRYEDEVKVLQPVIPRLERVLGPEDEWTIASWSELASAKAQQQKYGLAIQLQRRVVEANATRLGADHPSTQNARLGLAKFLHSAGEDTEATLLGQALLATKMGLGIDDDTTAGVRRLLANIERTEPTT